MLKFLPAFGLLLLWSALGAQVVESHPFATELTRALVLEAGVTASDIPHHVQYDLKLYDRHHNLTSGTWDIWRSPQHFERTDFAAGDFHYTHIEDLALHKHWRHFDSHMPLKIFDLRQNYERPEIAVALFSNPEVAAHAMVTFQQVDSSPFDCTPEYLEIRVCFDPIAHVLAFAQIMNQTITWEDWQPLGHHSVPRRFRIYDGDRLIVEASGTAEEVKTFPPNLFVVPPNQPDMGEPENDGTTPHHVVSMKPMELNYLYGNVLMHLFVDPDGKVKKAEVVDSDDDDIIGDAKHFSRDLKFAPEMRGGVAVPFDEYLYVQHSPKFSSTLQRGPS